MDSRLLDALALIVGPEQVLTGPDVSARFDGWPEDQALTAACIVRPGSTDEVSRLVRLCAGAGVGIVPHGGRTGLAKGARATEDQVVLSLERMTAIDPADRQGATLTVQAGAPLSAVQAAAADAGLFYGVDIGARGSATIGGTIATNAGGNSVLRYGMTREQVLGLRVVLADGTVLSSMNRMQKNNAGFDLKQMFIGSEGTLGVVTDAVLRLHPDPGPSATAFLGVADLENALSLMARARAASDGALTSFEVMWPSFIDCVLEGGQHRWPLAGRHGCYVLVELRGAGSAERLEHLVSDAWQAGLVEDGAVASSETQAAAMWAIRDDIGALLKVLAPAFIYDVSLPQADMSQYLASVAEGLHACWPEARLAVFGHVADGNLHLTVNTGAGDPGAHRLVDDIVYAPLGPVGGSVSAEHGIGLEKLAHLGVSRSPDEIALMRKLKAMLDPADILNPGKVVGQAAG